MTLSRHWKWIAATQTAYFALTGLWPIFHIESFLAVTGPKTDLWLVQLFGALICVPAAVFGHALWRGTLDSGSLLMAAGACIVLAAGDVIFVARGAIGPIYLLDAAIEAALFLAWCWTIVAGGRSPDLGRSVDFGTRFATRSHSPGASPVQANTQKR